MTEKRVAAYTLGCKVNSYDTEAMLQKFSENGYKIVNFSDFADIYIINTCTVTAVGDKKSRQIIRKASAKNPDAIIVAAGCYAQVNPEEVSKIEGVNIVLGTKDRLSIVDAVENYSKDMGVFCNTPAVMEEFEFENASVSKFENKTRAYLKVQEGCEMFCSYCIIPYARGRIRSRNLEDVYEQVKEFAQNGFKEIVLAGIHVASYGKDLENADLITLLKKVHEIEGIERIRLSSVEPKLFTNQFINGIKGLPKICDHFHLSLQSGSNRTLKRMNRKYTKEQYEESVLAIREAYKNVALTTDVIVGFPGETDDDFLESYNFIEKIKLSKLHVFPYSKKEGTKAATFEEQISPAVKEERSKQMLKLNDRLAEEFMNSMLNKEFEVLFEKEEENSIFEGHTTNYIKVYAKSDINISNKIVKCKLNELQNDGIFASISI